ncbi:alcohol dehydrogenase catalytic domain-containing protein, partial [Sphingomonas sp. CCH16-B10]
SSSHTVRRLVIDRPGTIDDMRVIETPLPALGGRDVRIAVRAFSLNFGDLLCVKGLYPTMPPYPFTPGMEVAGTVLDCGADVTSVRPGDPVVAMTGPEFGGHATVVTVGEHQLWRKPDRLSFEEACSLPIAAITMIEVFRRARLQPG